MEDYFVTSSTSTSTSTSNPISDASVVSELILELTETIEFLELEIKVTHNITFQFIEYY